MIKALDIKKFAKANNCKIEEQFPCSTVITQRTYNYQIGIELKNYVWFWWESFTDETDDLFFYQRYNQLNGYTSKGYKTGWTAEWKILGI